MLFFHVILRNIYRTYTAMSNTKETTNNNIKKTFKHREKF